MFQRYVKLPMVYPINIPLKPIKTPLKSVKIRSVFCNLQVPNFEDLISLWSGDYPIISPCF